MMQNSRLRQRITEFLSIFFRTKEKVYMKRYLNFFYWRIILYVEILVKDHKLNNYLAKEWKRNENAFWLERKCLDMENNSQVTIGLVEFISSVIQLLFIYLFIFLLIYFPSANLSEPWYLKDSVLSFDSGIFAHAIKTV